MEEGRVLAMKDVRRKSVEVKRRMERGKEEERKERGKSVEVKSD